MPNVSEIFQNFDANIPSRFEQISFKKKKQEDRVFWNIQPGYGRIDRDMLWIQF